MAKSDTRYQWTSAGIVGGGGAFVPNKAIGLAGLSDGTSNTMIICEQSGWQYYGAAAGNAGKQGDMRATAYLGAFTGANQPGSGMTFGPIGTTSNQSQVSNTFAYTLTTIRWPINAFSARVSTGANSTSGSYPLVPILSSALTQDTLSPRYGCHSTAGEISPVAGTNFTGANNPMQSQHPAGTGADGGRVGEVHEERNRYRHAQALRDARRSPADLGRGQLTAASNSS